MVRTCCTCRERETQSPTCSYCVNCRKQRDRKIREQKIAGTYVAVRGRKPFLTLEERDARKQEIVQYQREYRRVNKDSLAVHKRDYRVRVQLEGIAAYGGKCSCCGESNPGFLTIDHVFGRDADDFCPDGRRLTGKRAWQKLKVLGWPKERIQLLCFNCNCAKGIYGICPHQNQTICAKLDE